MPAPSYQDILSAGLRALQIRPSRFSKEQASEEQSTANTVCNIQAAMVEETAVLWDTALAESSVGTAVKLGGAVQDRLWYDRYGEDFEPRKTASVAVVPIELRRDGTEGFALPKNSRVGTEGGVIFRTAETVIFAAGQLGPLTVFAYCTTSGSTGNVEAGTIVQVLDKPKQDPTLRVTNQVRATGGSPAEDEGQLAARGRGYFKAARRGTRSAVQYACETVPGIRQAVVDEVLNPFNGKPEYRGTAIVADENGSANAALVARVNDYLPEFRGLGVPVLVTGGLPIYVSIELKGLTFAAGSNTTELIELVRAAIVATVNALPPGATLRVSALQAAVEAYAPKVLMPADGVLVPAGDQVVTTKGQAIRTRPDLVKINGT